MGEGGAGGYLPKGRASISCRLGSAKGGHGNRTMVASRVMMSRRNVLVIGGLLTAVLAACETSPKVEGSQRFVVGQRVTLELDADDPFVLDEFLLTDSTGAQYDHNSSALDYEFVSTKVISFTVPKGIASGVATLSVGAKGRDPYVFSVEIVRLLGVLDVAGEVTFVDLDAPSRKYSSYTVGTGSGSIALSAEGDRLLAIAAATGELHFLAFGPKGVEPFAPSVMLAQGLRRGALLQSGAVVASDRGVAYISQLPNGTLVLDRWLETGPVGSLAAAPAEGRVVAIGSTVDASSVNQLHAIYTSVVPPQLDDIPVALGGTAGGLTDVAITPDGVLAVALNTLDNTVTEVLVGTTTDALPPVTLPDGNLGPNRVVASPGSDWLAVVCQTTKSVVLYPIVSGALDYTGATSYNVDPRAGDPVAGKGAVDAAFAPGDLLLLLLSDGAITRIDLGQDPAEISMLREAQDTNGTALVIQP